MMSSLELVSIQNEEYKALLLLIDFCNDNNLKLFLRGGSVLGAVKYNDFVPWDDDIDVALPRNDYEKLIHILPEKINDDYSFISYQKSEDAHCYFPRIILNDQSRKERGFPQNNERGLVLIDILPLDGMPDGRFSLFIHVIKTYFYRILASLWTIELTRTVSMHKRSIDIILRGLHTLRIHKLYKPNDIYKKLDNLYSCYEYGKGNKCGILSSSKVEKEIVPYIWWGDGIMGRFRNASILVPANYDMYLKRLFGNDYASVEPPEAERIKSHLRRKV